MVLGIVWVCGLGSLLAIIFGGVAIRRINESNGWRMGKGMAIAGLVLGIIGVVGTSIWWFVAAIVSTSSY